MDFLDVEDILNATDGPENQDESLLDEAHPQALATPPMATAEFELSRLPGLVADILKELKTPNFYFQGARAMKEPEGTKIASAFYSIARIMENLNAPVDTIIYGRNPTFGDFKPGLEACGPKERMVAARLCMPKPKPTFEVEKTPLDPRFPRLLLEGRRPARCHPGINDPRGQEGSGEARDR